MEDQGGSLLREWVRQANRAAFRAVLDAQAQYLEEPRQAAATVSQEFKGHPPGWSLYPLYWPQGCYLPPSRAARQRAYRQLTSPPPSPVRGALRSLHQSESDHDVRFLKLLWEDRPQLVAAVALYSRLQHEGLHPDVYHHEVRERRMQLAVGHLESWLAEGRVVEGLKEVVRTIGDTQRKAERLDAHLHQLELLGWGRWRVPEGELEPQPTPGRGGGDPMPRWTLSVDPADVDGSTPDDLPDLGFWHVNAEPAGPNQGRSLWTHTVAAIDAALDPSNSNDLTYRRSIAKHVPEVFAHRRDPSAGGPLKRALDAARR